MIGVVLFLLGIFCVAQPDEGKWVYNLTKESNELVISKSMFKGGRIIVKTYCVSSDAAIPPPPGFTLSWVFAYSECWDDNEAMSKAQASMVSWNTVKNGSGATYIRELNQVYACLDYATEPSILAIKTDGVYVIGFKVDGEGYDVIVNVEMRNVDGYLSAAEWPLLTFFFIMGVSYLIIDVLYLIVAILNWRDLLKVQYWISIIILLGMFEVAFFYLYYYNIDNTDTVLPWAIYIAEWLSCMKRTRARVLVITMSMGFEVVKKAHVPTLCRVVGVGMLHFYLAIFESYLRLNEDPDLLYASVPLVVLDVAIGMWIFNALLDTIHTFRMQNDEFKLNLYQDIRHSLNFYASASVSFIFIRFWDTTRRVGLCYPMWKDLWLDDAYWQILFCAMLVRFAVLWRPTENNYQRYGFDPLLGTDDVEKPKYLIYYEQTKYPIDDEEKKYPIDDEEKKYPIDDELKKYPIDDEEKKYPIDDELKKYPIDDEEKKYPIDDELKKYPIDDEEKKYPIDDELKKYPIDDEEKKYPIDDEQQKCLIYVPNNTFIKPPAITESSK